MIELTDEMIAAFEAAFAKAFGSAPRGAGPPAGRRAGLEAVLSIIERDYEHRSYAEHLASIDRILAAHVHVFVDGVGNETDTCQRCGVPE
jgi:hypothetical protein